MEQLALPSSANEMASWIKNDLELSYKEALNRWPTSKMARIENTDPLIISRLKKAYEKKTRNPSDVAFNNYFLKLIYQIYY